MRHFRQVFDLLELKIGRTFIPASWNVHKILVLFSTRFIFVLGRRRDRQTDGWMGKTPNAAYVRTAA